MFNIGQEVVCVKDDKRLFRHTLSAGEKYLVKLTEDRGNGQQWVTVHGVDGSFLGERFEPVRVTEPLALDMIADYLREQHQPEHQPEQQR